MSYVVTGLVCFADGAVCGMFLTALLAANYSEDE